jgi:phosphoglycolate phosphatase
VIDYYRRLGFDFEREPFDAIAFEYLAEYDRRRRECRLREGALEVIAALAARGRRQHVLSAYEQRRLEDSVVEFGMHGCFDRLVGLADHTATSKVENGRRLMNQLGAGPGEVLFIGDTLHDHEVARVIGADCVLIPSGHHAPRRLARCGVQVLDSLQDVLALAP